MNKHDDIYQDVIDYIRKEADQFQKDKVETWLAESDENKKEYRQLVKTITKASFTAKWEKIDASTARNQLLAHMRKQKRLQIFRVSAIAASVAILISFSLVYFVDKLEQEVEQFALSELSSPGEFKATLTLSSGEKVLLSENTKDSLADAGAIINHDNEEGITYKKTSLTEKSEQNLVYNILNVARGEEYKLVLADGTTVWLNSESELKYPVAFTGPQREVYVKGEAFFDVSQNPEKAFIVHAGDVKTRVMGTEFNVMAYGTEEEVEITLVEGKVNVEAGESSKTILPGKQISVDKETMNMSEKSVDTRLYSSWKDGIIYFDELSLEKLTEKLSRWYDIDFVFEDDKLKHYAFTGAVKKNKPIEFTLDFLRSTSHLKFTVEKDKILVFEVN